LTPASTTKPTPHKSHENRNTTSPVIKKLSAETVETRNISPKTPTTSHDQPTVLPNKISLTTTPVGIPASSSISTVTATASPSSMTNNNIPLTSLQKKHQVLHTSWLSYLKAEEKMERSEMKYFALNADLKIAEFLLEIATKNLEDVGKRIEIHDWNFQQAMKITEEENEQLKKELQFQQQEDDEEQQEIDKD
jgi:hypothetical protein